MNTLTTVIASIIAYEVAFGIKPTCIYLGQNDFAELRHLMCYNTVSHDGGIERATINGLLIYTVDAPRYVSCGWSPECS